jgi:hypothetical protein
MKSGLVFDFTYIIVYKAKAVGIVTAKAIRKFKSIRLTSKRINVHTAITSQPSILIPLRIFGAEIIL